MLRNRNQNRRRKMVSRKNGAAVGEVLELRQMLTGIVHTIDFETVGAALAAESAVDGPAANATQQTGQFGGEYDVGSFTIDEAEFSNVYYDDFSSWSGWAYSNKTDITTPGFSNQLSAFAGSGANSSATYGVSFVDSFSTFGPPSITLDANDARPFDSLQVTNTTYAALSMRDGDAFAKQFGGATGDDPDWFLLTITGRDDEGGEVGTVEVYLADYRFDDNSLDYILDDWTTVDLSSLSASRRLEFGLTSSDNGDFGMNTPAYFAVDDIVLLETEPDLVATAFDAETDHLLTGETDVTFTVQNLGSLDAGAFKTHVVWSPNGIVGDEDDVIIADSAETFDGLEGGTSSTRTISIEVDRRMLFRNAMLNDPANQPVGTASLDVSQLFLVVDAADTVVEDNESNNAVINNGISSDDVTHFPWDLDGSGTVESAEARGTLEMIGTTDAIFDLNNNGIVTPLEALSYIERIGYTRADHVIEVAELQSASMAPATALPVLAEDPELDELTSISAETVLSSILSSEPEPIAAISTAADTTDAETSAVILAASTERRQNAGLFSSSEDDESARRRAVRPQETPPIDVVYEADVDWLSVL